MVRRNDDKDNNEEDEQEAIDEQELLKIVEARSKQESLDLMMMQQQQQAELDRPLLRPGDDDNPASRTRRRRSSRRHHRRRHSSKSSSRTSENSSHGSRAIPPPLHDATPVANHDDMEMVKILEARARAMGVQGPPPPTKKNDDLLAAPSSTRSSRRYTSKAALAYPRRADSNPIYTDEEQNSAEILKIVRERADRAHQQEEEEESKLEEGLHKAGISDHDEHGRIRDTTGQPTTLQLASQSQSNLPPPPTDPALVPPSLSRSQRIQAPEVELQPGAYAGAPGLALERNDTARFSRLGRVGRASLSSSVSTEPPDLDLAEFRLQNGTSTGSLSGLMVANLVTEPSQQNIPMAFMDETADNIDEQRDKSNKRAMMSAFRWFVVGVLLVVVIILAVVLGTWKDKESAVAEKEAASSAPTTSIMPSSAPSSMPSRATLAGRLAIKGLSESTAEAIIAQGTPQQKAYDWTNEHPEFGTMPNWRKQQMFALGTFHYSFENWPDHIQWMDYTNSECFWTTGLDQEQLGPPSSDWQPDGFITINPSCMSSFSCCPTFHTNPWSSNCNEDGKFNYMKLDLKHFHDGPEVNGTLPPEIGLLTGLTVFDIPQAGITGSIPSDIGMFSLLTSMNLEYNDITGPIPTEIGLLTSLSSLNLAHNSIQGSIPESIGWTQLTGLHLVENSLSSTLPSELGRLTLLETLDVPFNQITGILPRELGNCVNLTRIDARNNSLSGIPTEIGLITSLNYLMLRDNAIEGTIPSEIGNLSDLVYLSLERNQITGFASTFDGSSPHQLDLQNNQLTIIPSEIGLLGDDLGQMDLSNNLISTIPSELFLLTSLYYLQLQGNQIQTLPTEISQMTSLEPPICGDGFFSLSNNSLTSIPSELGGLTTLSSWTMDGNQISSFPVVDWSSLRSLRSIRLLRNTLNSRMPSELGLLPTLGELYLSSNTLTGSIPSELGNLGNESRCLVSDTSAVGISVAVSYENTFCEVLSTLDLHNNSLTGSLATEFGRLTGLGIVDLSKNSLTGVLPFDFGEMTFLQSLNIQNNLFVGSLTKEMHNLTSLKTLDMSFNMISGSIPTEIGQMMRDARVWVDELSDPVLMDEPVLQVLDLSNNQLAGQVPSELGLFTTLRLLDLSFNNLSGSIPSELGNLNSTTTQIFLQGNQFSGTLPQELCQWYCISHVCSLVAGSDIFAGTDNDCNTFALLEVGCSRDSLLDCSSCDCG